MRTVYQISTSVHLGCLGRFEYCKEISRCFLLFIQLPHTFRDQAGLSNEVNVNFPYPACPFAWPRGKGSERLLQCTAKE